MRKKALSAALALLMIAGNAIDVNGGLNANPSNARLNLSSITAVVMCFYTGEVLYGRNHDVMRSPASMTKMMTVYLVLEAIENGQIALDTRVPISAQTAEMSRNPGETNVILTTSGHYTVEQLMDLAIVMSASAASVALGELVGGSRMAFRDLMNGKANEWGIDARFWYAHASGPNNPMSARAMATITRNTFLRFPDIAQRTTIPSIYFGGRIWRSTNKLLGVYYGADGFKTGTSPTAGASFAGTAIRDGVRVIAVTMGSTHARRFSDTEVLLDYGFYAINSRTVPAFNANMTLNGRIVAPRTYIVGGLHEYVKIRDLAKILSGTISQFSVEWDYESGTINLMRGQPFVSDAGISGRAAGRGWLAQSDVSIAVNNEAIDISVYQAGGHNFIRLRDAAGLFGFAVYWDGDSRTVVMTAEEGCSK